MGRGMNPIHPVLRFTEWRIGLPLFKSESTTSDGTAENRTSKGPISHAAQFRVRNRDAFALWVRVQLGSMNTRFLLGTLAIFVVWTLTAMGIQIVSTGVATASTSNASSPSGWSGPVSIDPNTLLTSVSCPTTTFCVAVDNSGDAFSYDGSSWSGPTTVSAGDDLADVSCATAEFCVTLDDAGNAFSKTGLLWSPPIPLNAVSVSCPVIDYCMVVARSGAVLVFNGTTWLTTKYVGSQPEAVSCVSASFCGIAGTVGESGAASVYDGTAWSTVTSTGGSSPRALSCVSSTFCVGFDDGTVYSGSQSFAYNGTFWSESPSVIDANGVLDSLSCASSTFCVAGDEAGDVVAYDGKSWSAPELIDKGRGVTSISCASAKFCMAVDNSGNALIFGSSGSPSSSSGPASPTSLWQFKTIASSNPEDVSCSDPNFCMVVGQYPTGTQQFTESWNGSAWTSEEVPLSSTLNSRDILTADSCVSAQFCMAVSNDGAMEWNGSAWSAISTPQPTGIDQYSLAAISCPTVSLCIALGNESEINSSVEAPLIEEWDSTAWRVVDGIGIGVQVNSHYLMSSLSSVSCVSASSCIAVGSASTSYSASDALVESWNGTQWSIAPDPSFNSISIYNELSGISCVVSTYCVAIGTQASAFYSSVWNGSAWSGTVVAGSLNGYAYPRSISCPSEAACVVVGSSMSLSAPNQAWIARMNGTSSNWSTLANEGITGMSSTAESVSCSDQFDCAVIANSCGSTCNGEEGWVVIGNPQVASLVPSVNSVSPSTGSVAGGTSVTLIGSGFTGATGVEFYGPPGTQAVAAESYSVKSDNEITAVSPTFSAFMAGAIETIVVTTASGSSSPGSGSQFTLADALCVGTDSPGTVIGMARSTLIGYWIADSSGKVMDCGGAPNFDTAPMSGSVVAIAGEGNSGGPGYWEATSSGEVTAAGSAGMLGSLNGTPLAKPIVGMAATPDGNGYWLVAADGGIFAFGDAGYFGSTGGIHLSQPIVGMAATPDGKGYWEVGSDGGVFAFGDANFYGSAV